MDADGGRVDVGPGAVEYFFHSVHFVGDGGVFGEDFEVELGVGSTKSVVQAVGEIRRAEAEEDLPAPTSVRGRCVEFEYQNYCGDVW